MSVHLDTAVIAAVFAMQIAVLSFVTPSWRRRIRARQFQLYPPADYPRLYPVPKEQLERNVALFKLVHAVIGGVSLTALLVGLVTARPAHELAQWMFGCLLLQVLPMYVNMPWALRVMRAHRAMPPPSVRSAELRPQRAQDLVSPVWIGLGVTAPALTLTSAVIAYWRAPDTLPLVLVTAAIAVMLFARMVYVLLGKATFARQDPYMSQRDILRGRQLRLQVLFRGAAGFCAYCAFVTLYVAGVVRFDLLYLIAGVSVLFQLMGLFIVGTQSRDLETRDFSAYRPGDEMPTAST